MVETTRLHFFKITEKIPHSIAFFHGELNTIRYNGTKGTFKGAMFAKIINEQEVKRYFIHKVFI